MTSAINCAADLTIRIGNERYELATATGDIKFSCAIDVGEPNSPFELRIVPFNEGKAIAAFLREVADEMEDYE